jgi:L-seryl-tRNA(Ser) seleniumtransferase
MTSGDPRRRLPGVDRLLASPGGRALAGRYGTSRATEAIRIVLDTERTRLGREGGTPAGAPELIAATERALQAQERAGLRPVINATGVVLHTNLGRAPIAPSAAHAMVAAAQGYSNLEFDLDAGARGSRYDHCVPEIRALTGAEDGLVVNNCAGGLLLAMQAIASGGRVVVSRGELVEIGGGFRIPEVLESAGARLLEIGTTNRTRLSDYETALDTSGVVAILKVHRSNFRVTGFTEEVGVAELAGLARARGVPLIHDLGSGLLLPAADLGLPPEPRPEDSISAGADLVIFSGDKLLGGPQAGIVAGAAEWVGRLRRAPMCRALRVDKVTLAGLRATLALLRDPDRARQEIPALAALAATRGELRRRAAAVAADLVAALRAGSATPDGGGAEVDVVDTVGRVGGGTFPDHEVPSAAVAIRVEGSSDALSRALRMGEPSVVARVEDGALLIDLRAVDPAADTLVAEALVRALRGE